MQSRIPTLALLAACAALAAAASSGQTLYKYVGPDGRTVYTDKPPPPGTKVEKTTVDTSKRGVVPPSAREKATLKQLEAGRRQREMEAERVRRAEIALHDAEVAQAPGKEPQPYERIGTAKGNQRLTEAYFERQKKLEAAVETARQNLEKIRSGR